MCCSVLCFMGFMFIRKLPIQTICVLVSSCRRNPHLPHTGIRINNLLRQHLQAAYECPVAPVFLQKTAVSEHCNFLVLKVMIRKSEYEASDSDDLISIIRQNRASSFPHVVSDVSDGKFYWIIRNDVRSILDIKIGKPAPLKCIRANNDGDQSPSLP
jgi:hypothetical protein